MQSISDELGEESKITDGILQLVASVERLRSPTEGCLWFRRQTFQSVRRYLLEEVYEVLEPQTTFGRGSQARYTRNQLQYSIRNF